MKSKPLNVYLLRTTNAMSAVNGSIAAGTEVGTGGAAGTAARTGPDGGTRRKRRKTLRRR